MDTLRWDCFPLIYRHWVCKFVIKTLIIIYMSIDVHLPYVCDPLYIYKSI